MPAVAPLLRAFTVQREMNRAAPPRLPRSVPAAFVRERWPRHVLPGGAAAGPERRYYELCVLSELRAGDVWVAGRRRYRSFEERLVSREALRAMQEDGTLPVAVEAAFDHFIAARRDLLAARLAAVDRKARGGLLPQVTLGNLISGREALAAAMVWLRSRAA